MKVGLAELANQQLYREYRRRLDPRAVLDYYDAENRSEIAGSEGTTEIVHSCLIDRVHPHHTNGDASPSACLNVEKKLYCCYAMGWAGDLMHLIALLEHKEDVGEALPIISNFLVGTTVEKTAFLSELESLFSSDAGEVFDPPTYHPRVLKPWAVAHPYLYEERGISLEAINELQIGYDPAENRVVFPHYVEGQLLGWQKRTIPARHGWPGTVPDWPKYRNSPGLPKSVTLYHYDAVRQQRHAVVVESPMSVAKAVSMGFTNVVATFGAKVSKRQIDLLANFDSVYVWFDADPAGYAGSRKITEALYRRHVDVRVVPPDENHDLGDCITQDEVLAKLAQAWPASLVLPPKGRRR